MIEPVAKVEGQLALSRQDRLTLSYTLWLGGIVLGFYGGREVARAYGAEGFHLLLSLIANLALLVVAVVFLVSFAISLWQRRWRRSLSVMAAPLLVGAVAVSASRAGVDADGIRFQLSKTGYLAAVTDLPAEEEPHIACWAWGSAATGALVGGEISWTLVYDDSDQVAQFNSRRSAEWIRAAEQPKQCWPLHWLTLYQPGITTRESFGVRRMGRHFYLVEEIAN